MTQPFERRRSWLQKFSDAARGVRLGTIGHSSFAVHLPVSLGVVAAAACCRVSLTEWCLLIGCIFAVTTAELFNSALESLARAVDTQHNPAVGSALDIAAGAVLVCALGASVVGAVVFSRHLLALL